MRYSLFAHTENSFSKALVYLKIFTSPRLLAHLWLESLRFRGDDKRLVLAVAPALGDIIASTYAVNANRLRVVPPGIHLAGASDVGGSPALSKVDARKALGLPVQGWILLLVGHNFEKKGLAAVLRSLALLPADVILLVVGGSAKQVDMWRARCAQQGLDGRVVFSGSLSDAAPAFAAADCLVHATLDDTFGVVALEAMAANVPVLLSVAPFCLAAPLVQAAQAAWMLEDPHSEQQIAHVVGVLRADQDLRQAQLARAAQFVQNHAWSQVGLRQAQIYRHLLSAQGLSN